MTVSEKYLLASYEVSHLTAIKVADVIPESKYRDWKFGKFLCQTTLLPIQFVKLATANFSRLLLNLKEPKI